jgi:transposase
MPRAYSMDLRKRVIAAWEKGDSTWPELAERFEVGLATVNRWISAQRHKGTVEPEPHGGGWAFLIDAERLALLRALVDEQPDRTLDELTDEFRKRAGVAVSPSTIGRALRLRLGYSRKKKA